jgi:hypothetical protein
MILSDVEPGRRLLWCEQAVVVVVVLKGGHAASGKKADVVRPEALFKSDLGGIGAP